MNDNEEKTLWYAWHLHIIRVLPYQVHMLYYYHPAYLTSPFFINKTKKSKQKKKKRKHNTTCVKDSVEVALF